MKHFLQVQKLIFLLFTLLIISCSASENLAQTDKPITLSAIAKKPARYDGKEILLEGGYLGWKHQDCKYPSSFRSMQITRSDWVFTDGKWCCFVTGQTPKGLDNNSANPVPIKLTAQVKLKDSKVYLVYVKSELE